MRTIKFRAWDKETETMIYSNNSGDYWWELWDQPECKLRVGYIAGEIQYDPLSPPEPKIEYIDEIMQFTGLHDKNGKEIYEGDIVRHNGLIEENPLYISFLDGAFCIGKNNIKELELSSHVTIRDAISMGKLYNMELELEVMGNICENPELLEQ